MKALAGPLVGYRAWYARRDGRLLSLTRKGDWSADESVATCPAHPNGAPAHGCDCGIYAADSVATARAYLGWHHRLRPRFRQDMVVGAVHLRGPIAIGELAGRSGGLQYRAQRARVVAVAEGPRAEAVGRALGVPVVPAAWLESVAREINGAVQLRPQDFGQRPAAVPGLRPLPLRPTVPPGLGWSAARIAGRVAWWSFKLALRLAWWTFCRSLRLAWWLLRLFGAVLGRLIESGARSRRRD